MSNQQIYPQSTYPIVGDVASTPGSPNTTVQGFQTVPVVPTKPTDGQVYVYVASINAWVPADPVVSGPNAPGTPPTANPVQVGGIDDGNRVRELRLDSSGTIVSTNIEKLLMAILQETKQQTMILQSATGDSFHDESLGDF